MLPVHGSSDQTVVKPGSGWQTLFVESCGSRVGGESAAQPTTTAAPRRQDSCRALSDNKRAHELRISQLTDVQVKALGNSVEKTSAIGGKEEAQDLAASAAVGNIRTGTDPVTRQPGNARDVPDAL